ncbi:MAG: ABC transporter ATP-binding protein, partial [Clostridia bacterium]|nr:ABC transporter ATP-binding protein [Clostridia bacterium]
RRIGYLPEKPPLYDEMTVREYLVFVCRLREVKSRAIAAHVGEIMSLCGLAEVAERIIGTLSKGYRQRVGVAQAMCGDPPVLVLDEPTVGLDPRQVVEIRELIRQIGQNHTVIFSSHILTEIQQLCQRVVILHKGRLVRQADMAELAGSGDTLHLRASIAMHHSRLIPALKGLECVRRVKVLPTVEEGVSEVELECSLCGSDRGDPQTQLFRLLCGLDAPIRMLTPRQDSLEEIFLQATAGE